MSLANKLFCRITGRSTERDGDEGAQSDNQSKMAASSRSAGAKEDEVLKHFIAKSPKAKYTFDSERGAPQSELCREREGERQKECIMIQMQSTRLFQAMQDNGFFCALPFDPTQTHIECTPKP